MKHSDERVLKLDMQVTKSPGSSAVRWRMRCALLYLGIEPDRFTSTRWTQSVPLSDALATQCECSRMQTLVILPPCWYVWRDLLVTFFSSRIASQTLTVPSSEPVTKKSWSGAT